MLPLFSEKTVTVTELISRSQTLLGQTVEVRGYLRARIGASGFHLYESGKVSWLSPDVAIRVESPELIKTISESWRDDFRITPGSEDGLNGNVLLAGKLVGLNEAGFVTICFLTAAKRLERNGDVRFEIPLPGQPRNPPAP